MGRGCKRKLYSVPMLLKDAFFPREFFFLTLGGTLFSGAAKIIILAYRGAGVWGTCISVSYKQLLSTIVLFYSGMEAREYALKETAKVLFLIWLGEAW